MFFLLLTHEIYFDGSRARDALAEGIITLAAEIDMQHCGHGKKTREVFFFCGETTMGVGVTFFCRSILGVGVRRVGFTRILVQSIIVNQGVFLNLSWLLLHVQNA